MWNTKRSVTLSLICTNIVIVLAFAVAIALPLLKDSDFFETVLHINPRVVLRLLPLYYAACVPGLIALFHFRALLLNIRVAEVFVSGNVRSLRVISWCCFAAAVIFIVGSYGSVALAFIAAAIAFVGLIVRVVKNILEAAIALKDENDYTI
jgi:hypothetical protein